MDQDPQKSSHPDAPFGPSGSDYGAGSRHANLHLATLKNRLAYWDEWTELDRERLVRDPWVAERLGHLKAVETWLNESLLCAQGCPTSEELFDFAGPVEATDLDEERRVELRDHLEHCSSCAKEVGTLALAPPAPLLDLPAEPLVQPSVAHAEDLGEAPRTGRILYGLRAFLVTAAAVLLVWILGAREWISAPKAAAKDFPEWPVLRAEAPGPSLHPSGKVLARGGNDRWLGIVSVPTVSQASHYGVRIYSHGSSAFDRGELIATLENASPDMAASMGLTPGQYTLEPFAIVQGVERLLASTELEVCSQPEVLATLETLQGTDRVHFLHNAGWLEDARREASHLPQSPARDAYLAGQPR